MVMAGEWVIYEKGHVCKRRVFASYLLQYNVAVGIRATPVLTSSERVQSHFQ